MPVPNPGPWPPAPDIEASTPPVTEFHQGEPDLGPRPRSVAALRRAEVYACAAEANLVAYTGTSGYAPMAAEIASAWALIGAGWDAIGRR